MLTESSGLKRRIVAWLTTIVSFLWIIPGLAPGVKEAIDILNRLIEGLGGVAVLHAGISGTLSRNVLGTVGSAVSMLLGVSYFVPFLWPIVPVLAKLNILINAMVAGKTLSNTRKKTCLQNLH